MGQERERAQRELEAKNELLDFGRLLRKESHTITTGQKWREFIEPLQSILGKYKEVLSAETWQQLQDASKLTDETAEGIKTASDILNHRIENAIKVLPTKVLAVKTKGSSKSAIAGGIVAAVIIGGIFAYLNVAAYQVAIRNNGCEPIEIPVIAPAWMTIVGLDLPEEPIANGESAMAKLPPSTVLIDATSKETIKLNAVGTDFYFERPSNVDSIRLDGEEVLDQSKSFDLRESVIPEEQKVHELAITCRQT
jgi:hypothetical protein